MTGGLYILGGKNIILYIPYIQYIQWREGVYLPVKVDIKGIDGALWTVEPIHFFIGSSTKGSAPAIAAYAQTHSE